MSHVTWSFGPVSILCGELETAGLSQPPGLTRPQLRYVFSAASLYLLSISVQSIAVFKFT
jgi:hypothetical protein